MKKAKVLSDLRALIDDIESGRAEIEAYKYSFARQVEVDYGTYEPGNEKINIEFSRPEGKMLGEM